MAIYICGRVSVGLFRKYWFAKSSLIAVGVSIGIERSDMGFGHESLMFILRLSNISAGPFASVKE